MMSIKLCWQILHISSVTLHPKWNLSDSSTPPMLYPTLQCAASSPWTYTWRCARSCRREADGKMKTGRKILSSFPPPLPLWVLCHLVMSLLALCLALSLCFSYSSSFLAPRWMLPSFSINPFRPKDVPRFSSLHPLSNPRCHFIFLPQILLPHLGHLLPMF